MNYCVTYISAWLLMGKKCTAWRLTCGSMLIAWKDMRTHFANLSNDISTQRKKRSTENWIKVTRTLRTPVLLNTTPVIHQKKNKKRKNPFDKKKTLLNEMKWNIAVCGLVAEECPGVAEGLPADNYESESRPGLNDLIRSATWIRTDPARLYPPPLLARYLLWNDGQVQSTRRIKTPSLKYFFSFNYRFPNQVMCLFQSIYFTIFLKWLWSYFIVIDKI